MSARTCLKTTFFFDVHACACMEVETARIMNLLLILNLFLQSGFTALHTACQEGQNRVVEILVAAKANLDIQTNVSHIIETFLHVYVPVDRRSPTQFVLFCCGYFSIESVLPQCLL